MLKVIREYFELRVVVRDAPVTAAMLQQRLQIAAAALLLEVGRIDLHLSDAEIEAVEAALQAVFGLSQNEIARILELARQEIEIEPGLHGFTRLINEHLSIDEKLQVVEMLWRVAYADATLDKYEEHLVRRLADLLYIPHSQFIRAKLRAQSASK